MSGGPVDLCGQVQLFGGGEARIPIDFPCRFFEKPTFTAGYELDPNQGYELGDFPTASIVLASWNLGHRDQTGDPYYTGAVLLVRVESLIPVGVEYWGAVHYRFYGKAITGRPQ